MRSKGVAVNYVNRACSGAKIGAILGSHDEYLASSTHSIILNNGREMSRAEVEEMLAKLAKEYALMDTEHDDVRFEYVSHSLVTYLNSEFLSVNNSEIFHSQVRNNLVTYRKVMKIKPQISHVDKDTDVVIMTLGGNDLNFAKIVEKCLVFVGYDHGTCQNLILNAKKEADITSKTNKLHDNLRSVIESILQKMKPGGKVILVGYPYIVEPAQDIMMSFNIFGYEITYMLNPGAYNESRMIREVSVAGNRLQQNVIKQLSAKYPGRVEFIGQVLEHFNGRAPNGRWSYNPDSWLHDSHFFADFNKINLFHPNPRGHEEYAKVVKRNQTLASPKTLSVRNMPADFLFMINEAGDLKESKEIIQAAIWRIRHDEIAADVNKRIGLVTIGPRGSRVLINLTTDYDQVLRALDSISPDYQGEMSLSWYWFRDGVDTVLNQDFRNGVRKMAFVVSVGKHGSAWSNDAAYQRFKSEALKKAYELDPVEFYAIGEADKTQTEIISFAEESGGGFVDLPENLCEVDDQECHNQHQETIKYVSENMIEQTLNRPFVLLDGGKILAQIGQPVKLNAGGSYSLNGPIAKYHWDFDGDRQYDQTTIEPYVEHVYNHKFRTYVGVKVEDVTGQSNISSVELVVERDLDDVPDKYDNCPDLTNPDQSDYNDDGIGDACDPEMPTNPDELKRWWFNAQMINAFKQEVSELMADGKTEEDAILIYLERLKERFPGDIDTINQKINNFKQQYLATPEVKPALQATNKLVVNKHAQSFFSRANAQTANTNNAADNSIASLDTKLLKIQPTPSEETKQQKANNSAEQPSQDFSMWTKIAGAAAIVVAILTIVLLGMRKAA